VSPTALRCRIAGEIDGAYHPRGTPGPGWVAPRASLEATGFLRRGATVAAEVPSDQAAPAEYWARRTFDAGAALGSAPTQPEPASPGLRTPRPPGSPATADGRTVRDLAPLVLLAGVTEPGDAGGFVGPVRADRQPPDRVPRRVPGPVPDGPRDVVPVVEGQAADAVAGREHADVVLVLGHEDGAVLVFGAGTDSDAGGATATDGDSDPGVPDTAGVAAPVVAPSTASVPASTGAPGSAGLGTEGEVAGPTTTGPAGGATRPGALTEAVPETPSAPGSQPEADRTAATAAVGDRFRSVAEDLVAAEPGQPPSDADVVRQWPALIATDAVRLVEPGDRELLDVGRPVAAPPGT